MSIDFSIEINKAAIDRIKNKVRQVLKSEETRNIISKKIIDMPSIKAWITFLGSSQFRADFGIGDLNASRMQQQFAKEIEKVIVTESDNSTIFMAINQSNLRTITSWAWQDTLVNAWDAYEYGIVGGLRSSRIIGYEIDRTLNMTEKAFSRSGLALMKRGSSFSLQSGIAPRIFSVRSSIAVSAEEFSNSIIRKINIG